MNEASVVITVAIKTVWLSSYHNHIIPRRQDTQGIEVSSNDLGFYTEANFFVQLMWRL